MLQGQRRSLPREFSLSMILSLFFRDIFRLLGMNYGRLGAGLSGRFEALEVLESVRREFAGCDFYAKRVFREGKLAWMGNDEGLRIVGRGKWQFYDFESCIFELHWMWREKIVYK